MDGRQRADAPSGGPLALPIVVAMHARSGTVALNVVTAALDADPVTNGIDVRFAKHEREMAAHVREAASTRRVVALWSFYSPDFASATADLASVKEATRDLEGVVHVAGGVHATAEPLATLRAGFDLVALGEGESTIIALVRAIAEGRDPKDLVGIAHVDERGSFVSHGPGERAELDRFPAFNARYRKWNALEITRGCVYACSFCQTPYMFKARFRHRSVPNVRMHIAEMKKSGSRFVRFLTPTSLSYGSEGTEPNLDAVDELLAAVREGAGPLAKIYFGTFPSEIRPEHVTERALGILARWVDNKTLVIGGQSGSERVLRETRRGHGVEDVVRAVRLAVAHGFEPDVDFLLGLPGEEEEDRRASMRLAEELVALGARIHSHAFMPLPGTPLRDATPTPIEPATKRAMERLESRGRAYGQWRKQVITANDLVRARRA
jgi:B12-binding domain/radical SAM domain protein